MSPVSLETQPAPYVPYKSRSRFAEATEHFLQLLKDAGHRRSGQGVGPAVDMLLQLPGLVLTGGDAGRMRHHGVNQRLELLQAGKMEELHQLDATEVPPPPRRSNRRPPRDEAERRRQLAQQALSHLQQGSVQHSARTLSATPLGEVDDAVLHQLRDKHPHPEPPHLPPTTAKTPPPVSVSAETLQKVLQKLPKSSAAGPPGWTYQQLKSAMLRDEGDSRAFCGLSTPSSLVRYPIAPTCLRVD